MNRYKRGQHPNSRANLIPAKPGEVRNPKGTHKTDCIISLAKDLLSKKAVLGGKELDCTWEELIAKKWLEHTITKFDYFQEALDRFYGRVPTPPSAIEISGKDGAPLPKPTFFFCMEDGTKKTAQEVANGSSKSA